MIAACGACLLAQTLGVNSPDCKCKTVKFEGISITATNGILIKVCYPNSGPCIHVRLWEIPKLLEFFKTCNKLFGAPLILPPTLHLPAQGIRNAA